MQQSVDPVAPPESGRGGVLRLPGFRNLWLAQAVSTLGDQIFPIAATVAVLNAGGSAAALGLVLGAREVAIVMFALIGGVWADRLPRRLVMMSADLFRAITIAIVAFWPGGPPLSVLAVTVFLVGAGEAFFRPAETAMIASLVPRNLLAPANGMISVSYRTAAILGPGLGGILVAGLHSTTAAFALNSLAFLVSLAFLFGLREPRRTPRSPSEPGSFLREIREGLAEVRRQRWVAGTLIAASLFLLLGLAPLQVLLPVIGRERFGGDTVYATSMIFFALGGLAGAVFAIRYRPRHVGSFSWLFSLFFLVVPLALLFTAPAWVIFLAYFIGGFSWEPFTVYWAAALQKEIPADKLARVSSVDWMASYGLMPLGLALTGPLVVVVGQAAVVAGAALSMLVLTLAVLRVPGVKDFREPRLAERSDTDWEAPDG